MRRPALTLIMVFGLLVVTVQGQSLREAAARLGSVGRVVQACGPLPFLRDLARRADLVVEATVVVSQSYLTVDERDIYTDYNVSIQQVVFQRQVLAVARPGAALPIIFKAHGGTVLVDGATVSVDVSDNSVKVSLKPGDHVYLLARRDGHDGKWLIESYGVFTVDGADVSPPEPLPDFDKPMPHGMFIQRVLAAIASSK